MIDRKTLHDAIDDLFEELEICEDEAGKLYIIQPKPKPFSRLELDCGCVIFKNAVGQAEFAYCKDHDCFVFGVGAIFPSSQFEEEERLTDINNLYDPDSEPPDVDELDWPPSEDYIPF